jgi:hypothetical protein
MEGTRIPKKVFKARFEGVRPVGNPGKDGKMRCNRMLPAFCSVATGSWPLMIEHCEGRRYWRPRPVWAVAPLDRWMDLRIITSEICVLKAI